MAPRAKAQSTATAETQPQPSRRRRNEKFGNRRNEIVDLAAELFAVNGYAATGIREIGEAADLARGALYYYIDSKESLLGEIHDRVLDPLLTRAREITAMDGTSAERIRMVSEVLVRQVVERHDHVWVFLHEYRSLSGERRDTFRRKRAEFEDILIGLLESGVGAGEFEVTDLRLTLMAFLGMHNYTYQWVRPDQHPIDPVALSTLYCDIFLGGIASSARKTSVVKAASVGRSPKKASGTSKASATTTAAGTRR